MSWWPYLALGASSLIGSLGQGDAKQVGTAQTPGDAWLQNAIRPGMSQSLMNLGMGGSAYPVPQAPVPNYSITPYATPQAPFSSPADFIGQYKDTAMNAMENFWGGGGGGSAMGGWSGQGQAFGAQLADYATRNAMRDYSSALLPYSQMEAQGARDVFNAQQQQGMLGYQGALQGYGYQNQAMNPFNYYSMYPGATGNPMVQEGQQNPLASALQMGLGMYGMSQLFPFGNASAGVGAAGLGAAGLGASGIGVGGMTGVNTFSSGLGQGLGSYSAVPTGLSGATGMTGAMSPGMSSGIIGAGIMAAPLLGPSITSAMRSIAGFEKTAPTGSEYIEAYLAGVSPNTPLFGEHTMPEQWWFNNRNNMALSLSNWPGNYGFEVSPNSPLIDKIINKEVPYNQLSTLIQRYGHFKDPTGGG